MEYQYLSWKGRLTFQGVAFVSGMRMNQESEKYKRSLIILVSPLKSYWSVEEEEIDKNV
jgi:hypothetical protein